MLFGIKCTRKDIRKIMKLIITTIIIMFFTPCTVWAKDNLMQFDIVKPPVCLNNKGETVQYLKNLSQKAAFPLIFYLITFF